MTSETKSSGESAPPEDPINELIVQCLREPAATRGAALAGLCARHPQQEAALRRRYAFLQQSGLIEGPHAFVANAPERIGGFRILRRLGQGGMGVVYLAEQESLGRRVALKVIQPGAAAPPKARERFRREVHAVSLLDHPNICQVYDAGEIEGVPYLAMRYIEGETLAERIAREAAAEAKPGSDAGAIAALVAIGEQVARALHAAHEKGLVHRDVKPGNVIIEAATGLPVLLDFGLARLDDGETPTLTLSGDRLGTPAYMAPEQVAGLTVDRRTDVYALGATLYEALTGCAPHRAPTREALYRRILAGEITQASRHNARISRELSVVLGTALDRDPDRRYRTAADFADDLRRVLRREPILARPPGVWLRARRWCQRNPYAATALFVLAAGLGSALLLLGERDHALRAQEVALLTRQALEVRGGNPVESLELAWRAVQLDPGSPAAMKALRAAVHSPQVEWEIPIDDKVDLSFALWEGTGRDDVVLAWCDMDDQELWLWRQGEKRRLLVVPGTLYKMDLRFSPDGHRLAIAGADAPALVYDLQGTRLHELPLPAGSGDVPYVVSVAWHPTKNWLAVGSGDGRFDFPDAVFAVHLWNLDTGKRLWSKPVGAWPWLLQFTRDGELLLAAPSAGRGSSRAAFRDHDVHAFRPDGELQGQHGEHKLPCMEMAVSGSLVATGGHDGRLVLWDPAAGRTTTVPHAGAIYTIDVAPDGQTLATACEDGHVRVFDWHGNELHEFAPHGSTGVEAAVFEPGGRMLLVNHWRGRGLHTLDGRLLARLPLGNGTGRIEHFLRDGRAITVDRHRLRIWRFWPKELRAHVWPEGQKPVLSRSGARLVTTSFDGTARAVDWDGNEIWSAPMPPTLLCIDEEGRAYQATKDRRLLITGPDGRPEPALEKWGRPIFRLGCAPEGGLVAGSGNCRNVRVVRRGADGEWRTVAGVELEQPPEGNQAVQTSFHWLRGPDDSWRILAGTWYGIFEYAFQDDRLTLVGQHLEDDVIHGLAFSPDEQFMAVLPARGPMVLFERRSWSWQQRSKLAVEVPVVQIAFASDDRLLVTTADEVRIFDLDGGLVGLLPNLDEVGLVFARRLPEAGKIVTVAANNVMREWWLEDARVVDEARRLLAAQGR